jgi:hypothetical protein
MKAGGGGEGINLIKVHCKLIWQYHNYYMLIKMFFKRLSKPK